MIIIIIIIIVVVTGGHHSRALFPQPVSAVEELCCNTNTCVARHTAEKSYTWQDDDVEHKFLFLVLYTWLVKLPNVKDYWRRDNIVSVPFPGTIMTWTHF